MSIDWGEQLGKFFGTLEAVRQKRAQDAFTNAMRALQIYQTTDPYGQRDPNRLRALMGEVERTGTAGGILPKGFQYARQTLTTPGRVTQEGQPAQMLPAGLARAEGTPRAVPAQPEMREPATTTTQIALPVGGVADRPFRDVVSSKDIQQWVATNYGQQFLDAPYKDVLDAIPGLKTRLERLALPAMTPELVLAGMRFRPGQEAQAQQTVASLIAQGELDPLKLRAAVKDFTEAPQTTEEVKKAFTDHLNRDTTRLKALESEIKAAAVNNPDDVPRLVREYNALVQQANNALSIHARDAQGRYGVDVGFQGVPFAPISDAAIASMTAGAREKAELAKTRLELTKEQLDRARAGFKDLTPGERAVLTQFNSPYFQSQQPQLQAAIRARAAAIYSRLTGTQITPDAMAPPPKTATPGIVQRYENLMRDLRSLWDSSAPPAPGAAPPAPAPPAPPAAGKTYTDQDVTDIVAANPGMTAAQAEAMLKAKGYTKAP